MMCFAQIRQAPQSRQFARDHRALESLTRQPHNNRYDIFNRTNAMNTSSARFFDELAKMMTNAAGAAQGIRGELDTVFRNQAERVLNELEVVQREEFDAVRDMAAKARQENDELRTKIAALEEQVAALVAKKPASRARKAPAKPKTGKPGAA